MQVKYIGKNGEHYGGIPARDLTAEDWALLDSEQRKLVKRSPLYEVTTEKHDKPEEAEVKEGS